MTAAAAGLLHHGVRYRPEVDGLRAVAVLPVILFHAGLPAFGGGYVGVDVFFVISGYLITTIILRDRIAGTFSLAKFYERRARRILPALFVVMATCVPLAWLFMMPRELSDFGDSLAAVSTFVSNVLFWRTSGYFDGATELKPLLHTWSLGIEEQYYVIFPLFVAAGLQLLGKRGLVWAMVAAAIVSFVLSVWLTARAPMINFYLLPTRAWELLAGSLLAATAMAGLQIGPNRPLREVLGWVGLALILGPVFLYDHATPFPGLAALPPVLGTVLILAAVEADSLVGKLLTLKPVLWVGLISYSAYLWHQPLFAFARLSSVGEPSLATYLALSVATLILAWLSWRYIEAPFRGSGKFTQRQIFTWSAIGSLLFIGLGLGLHVAKGVPQRFDARLLPLIDPAKTRVEGCPKAPGKLHICRLGAQNVQPTLVLLGDSHAYMLADELGRQLAQQGRGGLLIHTDCHPVPNIYDSRQISAPNVKIDCDDANEQMLRAATADGISDVVIAIRWTLRLYPLGNTIDAPAFDNGEGGVESDTPYRRNLGPDLADAAPGKTRAVAQFVERLAARQRVTILYPVPEVGWFPPRLNLLNSVVNREPLATISTSADVFRARNAAATALLDTMRSASVVRLRPERIFCDTAIKHRCVVQKGNSLYYSDDDHLSSLGAELVVKAMLAPR